MTEKKRFLSLVKPLVSKITYFKALLEVFLRGLFVFCFGGGHKTNVNQTGTHSAMGTQLPGNQRDNYQHGGAFYPTVLGVISLTFRQLRVHTANKAGARSGCYFLTQRTEYPLAR